MALEDQNAIIGPAVGKDGKGRLYLFVRGDNDELWFRSQSEPAGESWTEWESLGGIIPSWAGNIEVATNKLGDIEVFVQGQSPTGVHDVRHIYQPQDARPWSEWESLGLLTLPSRTYISSGVNADGSLALALVHPESGVVKLNWQWLDEAGDLASWAGWIDMGDFRALGRPCFGANFHHDGAISGRLEIFVPDQGGGLGHASQVSPNSGWSVWRTLDQPRRADWTFGRWTEPEELVDSNPAVGRHSDGRLDVFVLSTGSLRHRWQNEANGATGFFPWVNFADRVYLVGSPCVASQPNGRLVIFARDQNGAIWFRFETTASDVWSGLLPFEGLNTDSDVVCVQGADGRLGVFARSAEDGGICQSWQAAPNIGPWSAWTSLGSPDGQA